MHGRWSRALAAHAVLAREMANAMAPSSAAAFLDN